MSYSLNEAAEEGNIKILHELLQNDPLILDRIDGQPFADTPLHVASRHGKIKFAVEIAIFQPSFTKKLNPKGLTPLHEALKEKKWETARVLAQLDTDLIRVKGTGGKTPLHVAAEVGPPQLLAELLFICPSSIQDVTAKWETAVHRAIKKNNIETFKVLVGWIIKADKEHVLNWKDINGNTVLHLAAHARSKEMVVEHVDIFTLNFKNEEAKDMVDVEEIWSLLLPPVQVWRPLFEFDVNDKLERIYVRARDVSQKAMRKIGFRSIIDGDESNEKSRDIVLQVAGLIATTTYQAALTPPGGYWQDNSNGTGEEEIHYAGQIIMKDASLFSFVLLNTLAFCFSVAAIFINVVQLKHSSLLISATSILFVNYYSTLFRSIGQGIQDSSSWSLWTSFHSLKTTTYWPEHLALCITLLVGLLFTVPGSRMNTTFKRLTDTRDTYIRVLVQRDQSDYDGEPDSDDDDASSQHHAVHIEDLQADFIGFSF